MPSRNRQSLAQGLDREVYQVVRKIQDGDPPRLTAALVYDEIRRSNSSLNRKPKRVLEDSIGRVLETIQIDAEETDSEATQEHATPVSQDHLPSNRLNRSLVGAWSVSTVMDNTSDQHGHEQAQTRADNRRSETIPKRRQTNGESLPKRRKITSSTTAIDHSPPKHVSLADFGGINSVIKQFKEYIALPMTNSRLYANSEIQPPRGILIHGPPGCGKTMIANAFAAELDVNFISISAPSVVSGMSGESEKALRDHFEEAKKCAPCLMFIDEIDAITPRRDGAQREMEKRIVAQLLTCMDDLDLAKTDGKVVIVMAATNRPDALDPALRRGGRFDKEINMPVPNEPVREQILRAMLRNSPPHDIDFRVLARRTPGFVGADLKDLVSTAGAMAVERVVDLYQLKAEGSNMDVDDTTTTPRNATIVPVPVPAELTALRKFIQYSKKQAAIEDQEAGQAADTTTTNEGAAQQTQEPITIQRTMNDFLISLPKIQPSALREGFATIPSTTFASIGALSTHIKELQSSIIEPILEPDLYTSTGLEPASGALLWGPPGCGKTLLAKAVANSSHANFISVKGPELLNKYVGESERAVRQVFMRARSSVPVIIFFDELDALVPRRDGSMSEASSRVVNTLLTELDGVGETREGIYIIAATNRPDMIDPAMLRPGRLDTLLFVGLPDAEGRVDILRTLCRKLKDFFWSEALADVARRCEGFSGADLAMLVKRAGRSALERRRERLAVAAGNVDREVASEQQPAADTSDSKLTIKIADFEVAIKLVPRSVSLDDMRRYEKLQREWAM